MALQSTSWADPQAPTQPSLLLGAGSAGGSVTKLNPGDYRSIEFDKVMNKMLDDRKDIINQDKEYIKSVGARITTSINELIGKKQLLEKMSQTSIISTTGVILSDYLQLVNEINALLSKIKVEIQESKMIDIHTLPSYEMKVGDQSLDSGPGSILDISSSLVEFEAIAQQLMVSMSALKFNYIAVVEKDGKITPYANAIKDSNPLSPDLSSIPAMSQDEIIEAMAKIRDLSVIGMSTRRLQQQLADTAVNKIKQYIQNVGVDKYLASRNNNDFTAASDQFKIIEQIFVLRSYARKKFGLKLGAIAPVSYPAGNVLNIKDWFSKDALMPIKNSLNSISSQTVSTDADLMKAFNDARQFVELYDRQLTPFLSKDATAKRDEARKEFSNSEGFLGMVKASYDYLSADIASHKEIMDKKPAGTEYLNEEGKSIAYNSDDTGVMARLSSFFITASGQMPTVEALLGVYRFVLADIREEIMVGQGDVAAMQAYFEKRFISTKLSAVRTTILICNNDKFLDKKYKDERTERFRILAKTDPEMAKQWNITETYTCGNDSTGIMQEKNPGGGGAGNFTADFQAVMREYNTVEVKRSQEARNLRNVVEMSLRAQAQEGDAIQDTGSAGF
jgi:hypothetical protein